MLVDVASAQKLFEALPEHIQLPTLSPIYVAADALRDPLLTPRFLVYQGGDGLLMHAVHEARVPNREEFDWQSAYGYGGPITHGFHDDKVGHAWRVLDAVASARRVIAEFVRFHPVAANHRSYPGTVRIERPVVIVDLSVGDLMASYSGRARTSTRKALNSGLRAHWESPDDARRLFPAFYRQCMREIGANDFYHFGNEYFDGLLRLPYARVLSVVQGREPVSMGLFLFGPRLVEYHLSGTSLAGRKAGATNLLLHTAGQTAKDNGRTMLYLGGGTSASENDALLRFKSSFAPSTLRFHIGYRIHDPTAYAEISKAYPELSKNSKRVLFYRR